MTLSSFDLPRFPQARKKEVLSASPNATSRSKNSPISAASWRGLVGRSDPGQGNKRKEAITVMIIIFFFKLRAIIYVVASAREHGGERNFTK